MKKKLPMVEEREFWKRRYITKITIGFIRRFEVATVSAKSE